MPEPARPVGAGSLQLTDRPLSAADFRRVAGNYATGIAVVTTLAHGQHHAMTANSFTTVSLNPLLVSVCVQRGTRFHEAIGTSQIWAASFLSSAQVGSARWFATPGRPLAEQFADIPTQVAANGCLLLSESLAGMSVTNQHAVSAGDHDIFIGEVASLHARAPQAGSDNPNDTPTIYFRSAYGHWLRDAGTAPNI